MHLSLLGILLVVTSLITADKCPPTKDLDSMLIKVTVFARSAKTTLQLEFQKCPTIDIDFEKVVYLGADVGKGRLQ